MQAEVRVMPKNKARNPKIANKLPEATREALSRFLSQLSKRIHPANTLILDLATVVGETDPQN